MFDFCSNEKKLENLHRSLPLPPAGVLAQSGYVLISCSSSLSSNNGSTPESFNERLKVSGAALTGDEEHNIDPKAIAREVSAVNRLGIEVAIVVGGGNISLVDPSGLGAVALTVPLLIVSGIKSILDFLVMCLLQVVVYTAAS
ncbi:hypothetical protein YC2023_002606 [Brassica napus]